ALVFRAMARQAKQVIVVADSSKFGNVSPAFVSPLEDIDVLITDTGLPELVAAAYAAKDIRVIRV
ncbi:MAG: DeoR/GlpR transcriptional regulator, partial [Acidobacteria bacterium]|nr:DeoR/GlpR transcriptional regulator [Acidobacteriota bacterium]